MGFHKHISLAGTVTVGPKGQVVIPVEVREKMNIAPGDKMIVLYADDKRAVALLPESAAERFISHLSDQVAQFKQNLRK